MDLAVDLLALRDLLDPPVLLAQSDLKETQDQRDPKETQALLVLREFKVHKEIQDYRDQGGLREIPVPQARKALLDRKALLEQAELSRFQ